jgi:hypothetical protein
MNGIHPRGGGFFSGAGGGSAGSGAKLRVAIGRAGAAAAGSRGIKKRN